MNQTTICVYSQNEFNNGKCTWHLNSFTLAFNVMLIDACHHFPSSTPSPLDFSLKCFLLKKASSTEIYIYNVLLKYHWFFTIIFVASLGYHYGFCLKTLWSLYKCIVSFSLRKDKILVIFNIFTRMYLWNSSPLSCPKRQIVYMSGRGFIIIYFVCLSFKKNWELGKIRSFNICPIWQRPDIRTSFSRAFLVLYYYTISWPAFVRKIPRSASFWLFLPQN